MDVVLTMMVFGSADALLGQFAASVIKAGGVIAAKLSEVASADDLSGLTRDEILRCAGALRHMVAMLADLYLMSDMFEEYGWTDQNRILLRNVEAGAGGALAEVAEERGLPEDRAALRVLAAAVNEPQLSQVMKQLQAGAASGGAAERPGAGERSSSSTGETTSTGDTFSTGDRPRPSPGERSSADDVVMGKLDGVLCWACTSTHGRDDAIAGAPVYVTREHMDRIGALTDQPDIPPQMWSQMCQSLGADSAVGLNARQYWEVIGKDSGHVDELVRLVEEVSRAKVSTGVATSHPLS